MLKGADVVEVIEFNTRPHALFFACQCGGGPA
jgi:hypothetical protein